MAIKRSPGLPVQVGGLHYMVGSGYQGYTTELDNTVKSAAEMLERTFNRSIEIRFNSDQRSGGAFLVNSLPGFSGNCQVGLGAGLAYVRPQGMSDDDWFMVYHNHKEHDYPEALYISTYVAVSALKNPALATSGNPGSKYCYLHHDTLEAGLKWLIENVDTCKILD